MYQYLDIDFSWKESDLKSFIPVMLTIVCYVVYWFAAQSEKIKSYYYKKYDFDTAATKHIFFSKTTGFVCMGIVPVIVYFICFNDFSLADFGLSIIPETTVFSILWTAILSIIAIPIVMYSARKPKNLVNYPQIRAKIWTKKTIFINAFGWFIFLFGYELLFRGILLFALVNSIGVESAIAVNLALYSAFHIPKGLDETIAAIPLGFILCIFTLYSGTLWIALIVHVVIAWTNSFTALYYNPEMRLKR